MCVCMCVYVHIERYLWSVACIRLIHMRQSIFHIILFNIIARLEIGLHYMVCVYTDTQKICANLRVCLCVCVFVVCLLVCLLFTHLIKIYIWKSGTNLNYYPMVISYRYILHSKIFIPIVQTNTQTLSKESSAKSCCPTTYMWREKKADDK